MEWGSEDMTKTNNSKYKYPDDRANRLYVESCNYDLSEGMTPKTYTPPLQRTGAGGMRFGRIRDRTLKNQLVVLVIRVSDR